MNVLLKCKRANSAFVFVLIGEVVSTHYSLEEILEEIPEEIRGEIPGKIPEEIPR